MNNGRRQIQGTHLSHAESVEGIVLNLIRDVSQLQLEQYAKIPNFTQREVPPSEDLSFDHWIASISLSAAALRLKFRVHFTSAVARELAGSGLGLEPEHVSARIAHDFVREYCNLTVGWLKRVLLAERHEDRDFQMSVPSKKPAYSDVDLSKEINHAWALRHGSTEIICVAAISVGDAGQLAFLRDFNLETLIIPTEPDANVVDGILFL